MRSTIASRFSLAPFGEPGRLTMSAVPTVPARARVLLRRADIMPSPPPVGSPRVLRKAWHGLARRVDQPRPRPAGRYDRPCPADPARRFAAAARHVGPDLGLEGEAGVDVVLQAHDHSYERFAPLDADGRRNADRGIRSFVVGTGGGRLREFRAVVPGSEVRYNGGHGVLKLSLRSDGYEWEFVPVERTEFSDRGEGRCH
jgi:hypothetical protein